MEKLFNGIKNGIKKVFVVLAKVFKPIAERLNALIMKALSLKFIFTIVQLVIGYQWFDFMKENNITDSKIWGAWVGYMVGAFTIYTTANVVGKNIHKNGGKK